jgi:hypothetical protein
MHRCLIKQYSDWLGSAQLATSKLESWALLLALHPVQGWPSLPKVWATKIPAEPVSSTHTATTTRSYDCLHSPETVLATASLNPQLKLCSLLKTPPQNLVMLAHRGCVHCCSAATLLV